MTSISHTLELLEIIKVFPNKVNRYQKNQGSEDYPQTLDNYGTFIAGLEFSESKS